MREIKTSTVMIQFYDQNIIKLINQWKFPFLALDFEAYHFLKETEQKDFLAMLHGKPFFLGTAVIESIESLKTKPLIKLINYQSYFNWEINTNKLETLKTFAIFLNQIVKKHQIKSFLVLGKELETNILKEMAKHNFLEFELAQILIIDIYDLYQSQEYLKIINLVDNNIINVKQTDYVLKINSEAEELLKDNNSDKKYWDEIWRKLDIIYSIDLQNFTANLQKFQIQYQDEIKNKNYFDLLKMILLLKIFIN